jgi:D-alanyl-lipoteichoic acid acyltransferase DltB (MBOAT superfamily)
MNPLHLFLQAGDPAASNPFLQWLDSLMHTLLGSAYPYFHEFFVFDPNHPMIFTRGLFWAFFAIVLVFYSLVYKHRGLRNAYLLVVSLFFYYKSSGAFFLLLVGTAVMDYGVGLAMHYLRIQWLRTLLLLFSITVSLTLLGFFKYSYFIVDSINAQIDDPTQHYHAVNWVNFFFNETFGTHFSVDKILLPVGISFFTFQTISYSVEVYRRKIEPVLNPLDYGFFVSFFPQLVAGPIVRATDFLPQLRAPYSLTKDEFAQAIYQIMNGLVKKLFIADFIAVNFIDRVYLNPKMYTGFEVLIAIFAYSLQVYCDFSGYTDIATGVARLMGFKLPKNFNSPYKAANVTDFWRRWHMSLSTWLRDFLYTPLGGNRKGSVLTWAFGFIVILLVVWMISPEWAIGALFGCFTLVFLFMWMTYYHPKVRGNYSTSVNLMITMLLGGLWHGSSWLFVIWGGLNGVALVLHRGGQRLADGKDGPGVWPQVWSAVVSLLFSGLMVMLLVMGGMDIRGVYILLVWGVLGLLTMMVYLVAGRPKEHGTVVFWLGKLWGMGVTLAFISFTRIWFRSPTLENTTEIFDQMFGNFGTKLIPQVLWSYKGVFAVVALGFLLHWVPTRAKQWVVDQFSKAPLVLKAVICILIVFGIVQVVTADVKPFIYFQF